MFAIVDVLFSASANGGASAEYESPTIAELATYTGPDREQMLAAGAKKEGKIVWYTALAGNSYRDLAKAFEAKYGVPVESYRGTSKDLISKFLAEAQAKRYLMDVAESSLPLLMLMQALKLIQPFTSPHIGRAHSRRQGRGRQGLGLLGHGARVLHGLRL